MLRCYGDADGKVEGRREERGGGREEGSWEWEGEWVGGERGGDGWVWKGKRWRLVMPTGGKVVKREMDGWWM